MSIDAPAGLEAEVPGEALYEDVPWDASGNYVGSNPDSLVTTDLQLPDGSYPSSDLAGIADNPSWLDVLKGHSKDIAGAALLTGGLSSLKSGADAASAQKRIGKLNASVLEGEAQYQLKRGQLESYSSRRKYQALLSKQAASYGASGVSMSEGTPLMVLEDTYRAQEADADLIKYGADIAATKARNQIPGVLMESRLAANKSLASGYESLLTAGGRWWNLNG